MTIPSYLEVLEELKKRKEATSTELAREFKDNGESWETVRKSVYGKLKRAAHFRSDVSGNLEVAHDRDGKERQMVVFVLGDYDEIYLEGRGENRKT